MIVATSSGARNEFVLAVGLALLGHLAHDLVEFGGPSPANFGTALVVFGGFLLIWWLFPVAARPAEIGVLIFAVISLLGGAIASVLPLSFWTFEPDQAVRHFAVHGLWALALANLIRILLLKKH